MVVEGNRARGVEYFDGRQIQRIDAKREVLLCAGAIDCPKLLMSSGVGNPVKLKSHGLQVVDSLPGVGGNLCDHPASALVLALPQIDQTPADSIHAEAGLFMKSEKLRSLTPIFNSLPCRLRHSSSLLKDKVAPWRSRSRRADPRAGDD